MEKKCIVCSKVFMPVNKNVVLCSEECIDTRKREILEARERYQNGQPPNLPHSTQSQNHFRRYVTCKVCGCDFASLTSHLHRVHNISVDEYKEAYPDSVIVSENVSKKLSDKVKGEKNPGWQHGGTMSPWSEKSKYHTPEQIQAARKLARQHNNYTAKLEYYLAKGYDLETAKQMRSERQRTFSRQKCIARLGQEQGLKRFLQRQIKWNRSFPKSNYSKISQKLFWDIYMHLPGDLRDHAYFAEHDRGTGAYNSEYTLTVDGSVVKPDFIILSTKQIIEFNGVYWHSRPGRAARDSARNASLVKAGYKVKIICESDYRTAPDKILAECLKYLNVQTQVTV